MGLHCPHCWRSLWKTHEWIVKFDVDTQPQMSPREALLSKLDRSASRGEWHKPTRHRNSESAEEIGICLSTPVPNFRMSGFDFSIRRLYEGHNSGLTAPSGLGVTVE